MRRYDLENVDSKKIKDIEVFLNGKYCPSCKANRFTDLETCATCGTKLEKANLLGWMSGILPNSYFEEMIAYEIERRRKLSYKKMFKGEYISVGETSFGLTKPGDVVKFSRVYCNLYTKKDNYTVIRDRYGFNLLIQPYPQGKVISFTLESMENGDIIVKNEFDTIILRQIKG